MPGSTGERPTFELGLVMAGAISAGSYTAGVLDFLLEALDAIEAYRAAKTDGEREAVRKALTERSGSSAAWEKAAPVFDPPHGVKLRAMSGASAGAMVTAITTATLGTRIDPVTFENRPKVDKAMTGNPFYDSWVRRIHYTGLLGTLDLQGGRPVVSLLDSTPLEGITDLALQKALRDDHVRPYVAQKLPIYLCVSNLRGVRYSLKLDGDDSACEHQMSMHADYMGFCYDRDGGAMPGLRTLVPGPVPTGDRAAEARWTQSWKRLGGSALASGAFPIGLAPRALERDFEEYVDRQWFISGASLEPERRTDDAGNPIGECEDPKNWRSRSGKKQTLLPLDKPATFADGGYAFVNVDGGLFNNEPLELCRQELAGEEGHNPRHPLDAVRAVVLIDPFPNLFDLEKDYDTGRSSELVSVAKRLFGVMVSQSRFKPEELALAKDPDVASRFAIMPVRYGDDCKEQPDSNPDKQPEKYAIACGALGGFGGFLSEEFRHHDFMLGRRNCQRFLMRHFALPAGVGGAPGNPLFDGWTDPDTRERYEFTKAVSIDGVPRDIVHLPIIPLLGKLADPAYTRTPVWPSQPSDLRLGELREAVLRRADAVKGRLVDQFKPSWGLEVGINMIWKHKREEWIDTFVVGAVRDDLDKRGIRPAD